MNAQPERTTSQKPSGCDPGEDMNVRHVHAAIWREEAEPSELVRRMPILLKHFYFLMFLWFLLYLMNWMGGWKWDEYEASRSARAIRDDTRPAPAPANPSR